MINFFEPICFDASQLQDDNIKECILLVARPRQTCLTEIVVEPSVMLVGDIVLSCLGKYIYNSTNHILSEM